MYNNNKGDICMYKRQGTAKVPNLNFVDSNEKFDQNV